MTQRIGLDSLPPVTADEALELCVHHLQLAAIYYMNTGDDLESDVAEARRIVLRDCPTFVDDPRWVGAEAFLRASHAQHEAAKRRFSGLERPRVVDGLVLEDVL